MSEVIYRLASAEDLPIIASYVRQNGPVLPRVLAITSPKSRISAKPGLIRFAAPLAGSVSFI